MVLTRSVERQEGARPADRSDGLVVKEIPGVKLAVAGAGHPPEFVQDVRRWIASSGLDRACIMTGILDEHDKRAALADCDVRAASAAENFGFSMFEAMACRKAVVCSETLNYASEVEQRDAGISSHADGRRDERRHRDVATQSTTPDRINGNGWAMASGIRGSRADDEWRQRCKPC